MNKAEQLRQNYYEDGVMVEIPGQLLTGLISMTEILMNAEIKGESKYKYKYLNSKGKEVKKVEKSDIESGKVIKVLDWERTIMSPTIEYSITEKGLQYAELMLTLQSIHLKNIEDGKTKNLKELIKIEKDKS